MISFDTNVTCCHSTSCSCRVKKMSLSQNDSLCWDWALSCRLIYCEAHQMVVLCYNVSLPWRVRHLTNEALYSSIWTRLLSFVLHLLHESSCTFSLFLTKPSTLSPAASYQDAAAHLAVQVKLSMGFTFMLLFFLSQSVYETFANLDISVSICEFYWDVTCCHVEDKTKTRLTGFSCLQRKKNQ